MPAFDLVIADEAHRCAGRVSSDFATILNAEAIKAHRRLFMTATPRYFTGRVVREAAGADFEVASMDNEEAFGKVFHRLGFAEAIERDLLTDYQVVVVGVDDATYRDWAQRGRFVSLDGTEVTDARTLAGQIGLAKAMRRYDLHRTITFHSRVERAKEFAGSLPEVIAWMPARQRPKGDVWSDYASGEMPAGQRHVLLQHLRRLDHGERGLLANARCLAEGVDVPTLDSVAFIDPRRSEVDVVQAVGRAIRLASEKTVGTIVIPVFIDTDEDPEIALDDSAFKPVWDVIKALRSHDDELGEELDELRRQLGKLGKGKKLTLPARLHTDLPDKVDADFARAFKVKLVEMTSAPFEKWFGMLEQFVEQNGHARVGFYYKTDEGYWLELGQRATQLLRQRHPCCRPCAPTRRAVRLDMGHPRRPVGRGFQPTFGLRGTKRSRPRPPIPQTDEGYKLGGWVTEQRTRYAKGALDADRQHRLEELTGWAWNAITAQWEEGFSRLLDYVERHGDARVSAKYKDEDGYKLGNWVSNQRSFRSRGTLDPDRERRLEELSGWSWKARTDKWEEGFSDSWTTSNATVMPMSRSRTRPTMVT